MKEVLPPWMSIINWPKFRNQYLQTANFAKGITFSMKRFLILRMVLLLELLRQGLVFGRCLPSLTFTETARACQSLSFFIHCLWKKEAMPVDKERQCLVYGNRLPEWSFGQPRNLWVRQSLLKKKPLHYKPIGIEWSWQMSYPFSNDP